MTYLHLPPPVCGIRLAVVPYTITRDPDGPVCHVVSKRWVPDEVAGTVDGISPPELQLFGEQFPVRARFITDNADDITDPWWTYRKVIDLLEECSLVLETRAGAIACLSAYVVQCANEHDSRVN